MQGGLELPKQLQSMRGEPGMLSSHSRDCGRGKAKRLVGTHQVQQARFTSLNPPKLSMLPEHVHHGSTAHRTSGATECNVP